MRLRPAHRLYPEIADPGDDVAGFAVLCPFMDSIHHKTEQALDALERLGIDVYRRPGCSDIAFVRSEMLSMCRLKGYQSVLFIDSDMLFSPRSALRLLRRPEPVVGGAYAQKEYLASGGRRKVNFRLRDDVGTIGVLGSGRDYDALGIGGGFLRIRTSVVDVLIEDLGMPEIGTHAHAVWPAFVPMVVLEDDGTWAYLGEDYAFCRRCAWCGIPVILDTTIRLYHLGVWWYGLEEAVSGPPERHTAMTLPIRKAPQPQ